jgi:hypothetical protein
LTRHRHKFSDAGVTQPNVRHHRVRLKVKTLTQVARQSVFPYRRTSDAPGASVTGFLPVAARVPMGGTINEGAKTTSILDPARDDSGDDGPRFRRERRASAKHSPSLRRNVAHLLPHSQEKGRQTWPFRE